MSSANNDNNREVEPNDHITTVGGDGTTVDVTTVGGEVTTVDVTTVGGEVVPNGDGTTIGGEVEPNGDGTTVGGEVEPNGDGTTIGGEVEPNGTTVGGDGTMVDEVELNGEGTTVGGDGTMVGGDVAPDGNGHFSVILTEVAETKYSMKGVGTISPHGTSVENLGEIETEVRRRGMRTQNIDLKEALFDSGDVEEAGHLVMRGDGNRTAFDLLLGSKEDDNAEAEVLCEIRQMPFDETALNTKNGTKVVAMKTFHGIVVADEDREPDIINGLCRVVSFEHYPTLAKFRKKGAALMGVEESTLKIAINSYYDAKTCGISYRAWLSENVTDMSPRRRLC